MALVGLGKNHHPTVNCFLWYNECNWGINKDGRLKEFHTHNDAPSIQFYSMNMLGVNIMVWFPWVIANGTFVEIIKGLIHLLKV